MTSPDVLAAVEAGLTAHFGHPPQRASVSFVGVEAIEILRFEPIPGERAYLTLGMSRHPMSAADDLTLDAHGPRAELMLHLRDESDDFADVWRRLAVLAAAPAVEGVVYRVGMSVDIGESLAPRTVCTGVLVGAAPLAPIDTPRGVVEVLQVLPATSAELAWCRVRGSDALTERWERAGTDLLDLSRPGVDLH